MERAAVELPPGRVARNLFVGFGGTLLQRGLAVATTLVLARGLGEENFGIYSYVAAYMTVFTFLADLGVERVVTREAGKFPSEAGDLVGDALLVKGMLCLLSMVAAVLVSQRLGLPPLARDCIFVAALGLPATLERVFRGFLESRFALAHVFGVSLSASVGFFLAALVCVVRSWPLPRLFWLALGIGWGTVAAYAAVARRAFGLRISAGRRPLRLFALLRDSWEVGLFGFLFLLVLRVDQLMLLHLRSASEVGLYSASVRVAETLGLLPEAVVLTLFPLLVRRHTDAPAFRETYRTAYRTMGLLFFPLGISFTCLAPTVLRLLFGSHYVGGSTALALLTWNMFFAYTGVVYLGIFLAEARQRLLLAVSALTVLVNVALNLLWIPRYGAAGAAGATLAANVAGFLSWLVVPSTRPYMTACLAETWKGFLSAAFSLGTVALCLRGEWGRTALALALYFALLGLSGGMRRSDWLAFRTFWVEGLGREKRRRAVSPPT
ncbi:MAG: hypothetical protein KatS3mg076_0309 [Candidatus Binatia bacterium]|nr:MAG: hypothetical protein KatS3mg076_0309 [Candidatus Binatia bacterium]